MLPGISVERSEAHLLHRQKLTVSTASVSLWAALGLTHGGKHDLLPWTRQAPALALRRWVVVACDHSCWERI